MIYCTYNISVSEEMQKILDRLEIKNYQIFDNVLAKTEGSPPRFDTPVWPGYNNSLLIQTENKKKDFVQLIREYNKSIEDKSEEILCISWQIENH